MNYLFIDNDSGENFFVQEESLTKAVMVAKDYFYMEYVEFLGEYDDFEAEMLGYDTY